MTSEISGVVEKDGVAIEGAIVEVSRARPDGSAQSGEVVARTVTDSNGQFVIETHPDGESSTDEWHVSAYYQDANGNWNHANTFPGVEADLIAIPDSENLQSRYVADVLDLSEGDPVSTWGDLEGNFDGTQETSADQPTFRDSDLNGRATVEFDGDYLLTGHNQNSNEENSLYIVTRVDDTSDDRGIYGAGGSSTGNRNYIRMEDGPNWQAGYGDTAATSSSATSGEWKILGFNAGADGDFQLRVDGSERLSSSFSGEGENPDDDGIGARNSDGVTEDELVGKIAEILRYDVDHGDETASEVEQFLDNRYDILD